MDRPDGRPPYRAHAATGPVTFLERIADLRLVRLALLSCLAVFIGLAGTWTDPADARLSATGAKDDVIVWIADNGFHTDLILPREALRQGGGAVSQAVDGLPPGAWIAVGWGDARFYPDTRPIRDRLVDGARAFFWPGNASVILLDPVSADPAAVYPPGAIYPVRLSQPGFLALRTRLEDSMVVREGAPVRGPASQVGDGQFFDSRETFWIGHLCNHWAAELLHAGGVPVRPWRTIFSAEIVRMAHSETQTPSS